uniref:protein-serine/threonine phosphatase n=1 Tax=Musa acuminata subsp. malaccensis TaxID=214687 RepID=A0A804JFA7_MUSAM
MDKLCCFSGSCSQLAGHSSNDAGKGKSSLSGVKITYGFSLVKGRANHPMEDYHVAKFIQIRGQELGLFAIFDGHLGDDVPAYLQKHLFTNILKEEDFWNDPGGAIFKAYGKTDKAILSQSPDLGQGGSTAVTAILMNGRRLWIANIGDSRAVLAKGREVIQLTVDHEPSTERGSIENRGGFVSNMPASLSFDGGQ